LGQILDLDGEVGKGAKQLDQRCFIPSNPGG
jgi:hypothetical protein